MPDRADILAHAAAIVAAYVGANRTEPDAVPGLLRDVHATLLDLATAPDAPPGPVPAVPVADSITEDALVCLEDGQSFRSLKRHLRSEHGLSPEDYREKWSLPADYPMVAPGYSRQRSQLAKRSGLGRSG